MTDGGSTNSIYKDSLPNQGVTGQTTVGTSEIKLRTNNRKLLSGLVLKAPSTNTGTVYVGFGGATTAAGFILEAGDTIPMLVEDTDMVYVIGSAAGQVVSYIGQ